MAAPPVPSRTDEPRLPHFEDFYANKLRGSLGLTDAEATLEGAALAGGLAVLRRGKKTLAGVRIG